MAGVELDRRCTVHEMSHQQSEKPELAQHRPGSPWDNWSLPTYLAAELQPTFWSSVWTPCWTIGSDVAEGEYEKGIHYSNIQLSLTDGNFE